MLISSTKDIGVDRLKMLVFGTPGAGKTSLAGTIDEPTVVLSAEAGLLVLKDKKLDVIDLTTDNSGKLIAKENRTARLAQAYKYLETDEARAKYKWVFIDSLTEIAQNLVESLHQQFPERKDAMVLWGEYSKNMRGIIKNFRDLPYYNVVFTALSERSKDDNGTNTIGVDMSGKIAQQLPQFFDESFLLFTSKDADGNEVRKMLTRQTENSPYTKDRSGKLEQFEAPNLAAIAKKIKGVK